MIRTKIDTYFLTAYYRHRHGWHPNELACHNKQQYQFAPGPTEATATATSILASAE